MTSYYMYVFCNTIYPGIWVNMTCNTVTQCKTYPINITQMSLKKRKGMDHSLTPGHLLLWKVSGPVGDTAGQKIYDQQMTREIPN